MKELAVNLEKEITQRLGSVAEDLGSEVRMKKDVDNSERWNAQVEQFFIMRRTLLTHPSTFFSFLYLPILVKAIKFAERL